MGTSTVRGQITITDLNDGRSVNLYIEANHPGVQVYNQDGGTFVPDWSAADNGLTLTPVLLVSGVNSPALSNPVWSGVMQREGQSTTTVNDMTTLTGVTMTNGVLSISRNLLADYDVIRLECSGTYVESATISTPVRASITFNKNVNTGQLCFAQIQSPYDTFRYQNDGVTPGSIVLTALLFRGSRGDYDSTPGGGSDGRFNVTWQVYNGTTWENIVSGATATNAGTGKTETKWTFSANVLTVYPAGVDNIASFRAVVTDTEDGNKVYYATQDIHDSSDPISMEISSSFGMQTKGRAVGSGATLAATLKKNGLAITAAYDAVYSWGRIPPRLSGENSDWSKTGQSISVASSDLVAGGSTTFSCTAEVTFDQTSN